MELVRDEADGEVRLLEVTDGGCEGDEGEFVVDDDDEVDEADEPDDWSAEWKNWPVLDLKPTALSPAVRRFILHKQAPMFWSGFA